MRRAGIVIAAVLALGAITWLLVQRKDAPTNASNAVAAEGDAAAPPSAPLALGATAPERVDSIGDPSAPAATDAAARETAAELDLVDASHALTPDEPTVVKGRVVDRNGTKQSGCRIFAAPHAQRPHVGLKHGREWPLDALAIDRDGARERMRAARQDPDLDRDDEMARIRRATTDADGHFEIEGLPSGPIRLALRSDSLAPRDIDDLVLHARETLDAGDLVLDFPLVLEGEVVDSEGRAIANARIDRVDSFDAHAPQPGPAIAPPLAVTGANGRFRTTPLPYGSWSLLATHAEHLSQRIDGACEDASRVPAPITFTLPDAMALTGNVFGPPPEELATLCVVASPEATWREPIELRDGAVSPDSLRLGAAADQRVAKVATDGRFRLLGLDPAKAHTLRVGPIGARGDELACVYLTARTQAGAREIDLTVPRGGAVSFEARSRATFAPIEDFEVWIDGAAPRTLVDEKGVAVRHYPGGIFRLSGVRFPPPQSQRLTIAALGHAIYTQDLYADSGSDVALGVIALDALYTLEVSVTDEATGSLIQGARVHAFEEIAERNERLAWPSGTTDRKGIARVTSYAANGSSVCIDADGFASQCIRFGEPGWTAGSERCDVRLARGVRVRVHVSDREGAPVAGMSVATVRARAVSDDEGIATFDHVAPGLTKFSCVQIRERAPEASIEVFVGQEGELDVWVTSPSLATLVGRVRDGARLVGGAELSLLVLDAVQWKRSRRMYAGVAGSTRSDSNGAFRFENAEAGPFVVEVTVDRSTGPLRFETFVEAPQSTIDIDLLNAHVRGRVLDARGHGVAGATVWLAPTQSRASMDWYFLQSLPAARAQRDGEGRRTPCFTTDAGGGFDLFVPRDAGEIVLCASHDHGGAGSVHVARSADVAVDVDIRLAPAGALELFVDGAGASGNCLVLLVPDAEPCAWLLREVSFGQAVRWDALAPGAWQAWRVGTWLDGDKVRTVASNRSLEIQIEAGHTAQVSFPLQ